MRTLKIMTHISRLAMVVWAGTFAYGAGQNGILAVDNFTAGLNEKGLPKGWVLEGRPESGYQISIVQDGGKDSLRLTCDGSSFGVKKEIAFDIRKYPYLNWRWKATQLPKDGDIRQRSTDDEAGQVYVVFPRWPAMINSHSVGYIWDNHAPVGLTGVSTAYSKMRYVVLQSGSADLNQWIRETRNVYEDYKKLFEEEPPMVGAVLLYINAQHTRGKAQCLYGDIFFSATPPTKENWA
jgi:hypothetical protein